MLFFRAKILLLHPVEVCNATVENICAGTVFIDVCTTTTATTTTYRRFRQHGFRYSGKS